VLQSAVKCSVQKWDEMGSHQLCLVDSRGDHRLSRQDGTNHKHFTDTGEFMNPQHFVYLFVLGCTFVLLLISLGQLAKSDFGSILKKKRFSVQFRFYNINHGFSFSVQLGLHSFVDVDAVFHLRLYGMTLEMMYFRAELVQLIVSRSDSELEVQRYSMKKNTLTVDPIVLQDVL